MKKKITLSILSLFLIFSCKNNQTQNEVPKEIETIGLNESQAIFEKNNTLMDSKFSNYPFKI